MFVLNKPQTTTTIIIMITMMIITTTNKQKKRHGKLTMTIYTNVPSIIRTCDMWNRPKYV